MENNHSMPSTQSLDTLGNFPSMTCPPVYFNFKREEKGQFAMYCLATILILVIHFWTGVAPTHSIGYPNACLQSGRQVTECKKPWVNQKKTVWEKLQTHFKSHGPFS